jgi:hypothetical protein
MGGRHHADQEAARTVEVTSAGEKSASWPMGGGFPLRGKFDAGHAGRYSLGSALRTSGVRLLSNTYVVTLCEGRGSEIPCRPPQIEEVGCNTPLSLSERSHLAASPRSRGTPEIPSTETLGPAPCLPVMEITIRQGPRFDDRCATCLPAIESGQRCIDRPSRSPTQALPAAGSATRKS